MIEEKRAVSCRARKPFDPVKLWGFANKYFHVQQPEMHDHDEEEEEGEDMEEETKEGVGHKHKHDDDSNYQNEKRRCPEVRPRNLLEYPCCRQVETG